MRFVTYRSFAWEDPDEVGGFRFEDPQELSLRAIEITIPGKTPSYSGGGGPYVER